MTDESSNNDDQGWLSIATAANTLGLTENAVRLKIRRGRLRSRKLPDGRLLVSLTRPNDRLPHDESDQSTTMVSSVGIDRDALVRMTAERDALLTRLKDRDDEVGFLRDQLRSRDQQVDRMQILLQQAQSRIPELPPPADPARSWWRWWRRG